MVGDCVYGADFQTRRLVEAHGRGYVLAVTLAQRLGFKHVEDWLEDVPAKGWRRLSAGDGAKGPRLYDWAYLPYRTPPAPGWKTGLLIRRRKGRSHQFTFYLTRSPEETALAELVRIAGQRWRIESCFEEAKGETGLDEYEVRAWTGWYRHITLSMLAHAYLTIVRQHAIGVHRLGDARRINQDVAVAGFEQHRRAIVVEFDDRRQLTRRPSGQLARHRLAAHSDLIERRLDLVERQRALIG